MTGDTTAVIPDRGLLRASYDEGRPSYAHIMNEMERRVRAVLETNGLRPTIKGRIKSFDSWYGKLIRLLRQARQTGQKPIPINDVVALRAVCPFLGDLNKAERALCAAFSVVEIERKGSERSFREFGYESIHLLVELPEELRRYAVHLDQPRIEIQLRTILQEAWAEVEHEIVYKSEFTPFDEPMKRKLAALNANLSLADIIFQEILDYQRRLNGELERRRANFYGKIESTMDLPLAEIEESVQKARVPPALDALSLVPKDGNHDTAALVIPPAMYDSEVATGAAASLDDLLLAGLMAHNREEYAKACSIYSEILAREPAREIASVVHKHRGMAYFSQSKYDEAIKDFSDSLELDHTNYKAAYYRGVVRSVLLDYQGAIDDFDLALSIHPYHFYSRYRRGVAWWHLGDYTQSLADSEAALKLEPDNVSAARLKALALGKLKM